ncbi:hypothetical protein [Pelagibacterium sp. H642]|uniref:hypothetical protein n=1 Tax=Pelagibacterium sp. H642 TaxID=1881069 RepID=UPI002814C3BA|nr:hypothetical protein [Pelagibacterium sp. H642]WMT90964.1 hypothetical protein NO934_01540 [Pelagibacterium sp. H642]
MTDQPDKDTPIRLSEAVKLAFPFGGMTVSGLRREAARGRLVMERIAGKDFVTLAAIEEMRKACVVEPEPSRPAPRPRAQWREAPSDAEASRSAEALFRRLDHQSKRDKYTFASAAARAIELGADERLLGRLIVEIGKIKMDDLDQHHLNSVAAKIVPEGGKGKIERQVFRPFMRAWRLAVRENLADEREWVCPS